MLIVSTWLLIPNFTLSNFTLKALTHDGHHSCDCLDSGDGAL